MICSMVKKGLIGASLGALALGLVFGTSAPSYIKTAFCNARGAVKSSVPIQFEIDRLRGELDGLNAKVASSIQELAREEKAVDSLKVEVASGREKLGKEKTAIVALKEKVGSGDVRLAGHTVLSKEAGARLLEQKFDAYGRSETVLVQKEKTLALRERNLAGVYEQLRTLSDKKVELKSRLDAIEAQMKALEASQDANGVSIDIAPLKSIDDQVRDLEQRIDLKNRELELTETYLAPEITDAPAAADRDVVTEIEAKFGGLSSSEKSL